MAPEKNDLEEQLRDSLNEACKRKLADAGTHVPIGPKPRRRRLGEAKDGDCSTDVLVNQSGNPNVTQARIIDTIAQASEACLAKPMSLRQKLGEVRRRIGYIQKRGYNERQNYNYVAAADIAGTIGDILAELGVVVIPRLESISYEPHASGRLERVARVIMSYAFTDEDSGDEIIAKVAGEGLDIGDKASYKAMTGALKYALLQSFLLATGDDPEDERAESRWNSGSDHQISAEQQDEIRALIENTGTDPERVCAYYKISALAEMTESTFRRAVDLLKRKLDKQNHGDGGHAQN